MKRDGPFKRARESEQIVVKCLTSVTSLSPDPDHLTSRNNQPSYSNKERNMRTKTEGIPTLIKFMVDGISSNVLLVLLALVDLMVHQLFIKHCSHTRPHPI